MARGRASKVEQVAGDNRLLRCGSATLSPSQSRRCLSLALDANVCLFAMRSGDHESNGPARFSPRDRAVPDRPPQRSCGRDARFGSPSVWSVCSVVDSGFLFNHGTHGPHGTIRPILCRTSNQAAHRRSVQHFCGRFTRDPVAAPRWAYRSTEKNLVR